MKKKPKNEELVEIDHVGRVPEGIARAIYKSLSRYFAGKRDISPERRREIASMGGTARAKQLSREKEQER